MTDIDDLSCPLCGYNLRGLTESRCPECGFAFSWAELADARRDRHPWLFEHGRWSVRRLASTAGRAMLPRRFWAAVTPANPIFVRRLAAYWAAVGLPLAGVLVVGLAWPVLTAARDASVRRAAYRPVPGRPGLFASAFNNRPVSATKRDELDPRPWSRGFFDQLWRYRSFRWQSVLPDQVGPVVVVVLAWPWLTAAAMLAVFRPSRRRATIDGRHVLRAAVYAAEVTLWAVVAWVVLYQIHVSGPGTLAGRPTRVPLADRVPLGALAEHNRPVVLVGGLCAVAAGYRLSVACGRYLRFDRPVLTAAAVQAIVGLIVVVVLIRLQPWL